MRRAQISTARVADVTRASKKNRHLKATIFEDPCQQNVSELANYNTIPGVADVTWTSCRWTRLLNFACSASREWDSCDRGLIVVLGI